MGEIELIQQALFAITWPEQKTQPHAEEGKSGATARLEAWAASALILRDPRPFGRALILRDPRPYLRLPGQPMPPAPIIDPFGLV